MLKHYSPKLLVGFNLKFDILHAIARDEENLDAWMDWVTGGGQVWDTQLAEYLLEGMLPEAQMLSLDEVAPKYGGVLKVDEVKAMWEAGIDTPDIPDDLMLKYLPGDLTNTEVIFVGQMKRARAVGQTKSIMLNMGSLLYTIEAERNGMAVDTELGFELAAELVAEISELAERLHSYLPADLPFEFKWTSRFHQSALIFGGQVKYEVDEVVLDDNLQPVYYQTKETHFVREDGTTTPDAGDLNIAFFRSGKNQGQPKTKQVTVPDIARGPKTRKGDAYFQFPGYTQPDPSWASSTPGVYSVAGEVIEALGERDIPFLKDLSKRARLQKDLGTYFITTDPKTGEQTGMLTLVQGDGCIHGSINHCLTVTARFSSSGPNLQNLSGKEKSKVKSVFVSRWGKDGVITQSDFTSLEVYIQAVLTLDKQLIADLKAGLDMHCKRAAAASHVDYQFVVDRVEAEDPEWKGKRKKAKVFSFQRAYGAGAAKIALTTGMDIDEVYELIAADEAMYPEIEPFYEKLTKQIEASKRGIRKVVPHPDFPAKQVELRTGFYRTPDNKLYAYIEQCSPKFVVEREGRFSGFSPTEIKNYVVQGGGAEHAKAAMWLLVRAFYARKNFGGKALLISQVHDACYGDFHNSVKFEAAALLHACMESASEFMEFYFGWHQPVHVPSETTWGSSMIEEQRIEGIKEAAQPFREQLRNTYMRKQA
ncbi:DNA polymerase [Pseudomonas phage vB_PpuP-Kurepalu-1]